MVKHPPANAGDVSLIPGLGRSPGGGHGNPLQCSSLENPMDRGAWWAPALGVAKSQPQLSSGALPRMYSVQDPTWDIRLRSVVPSPGILLESDRFWGSRAQAE